jgi:hypothetical protein
VLGFKVLGQSVGVKVLGTVLYVWELESWELESYKKFFLFLKKVLTKSRCCDIINLQKKERELFKL